MRSMWHIDKYIIIDIDTKYIFSYLKIDGDLVKTGK